MRYGIKYGGVIYVSTSPDQLVKRLMERHGAYVERGAVVDGGWARVVEPVNEMVLATLRSDYIIEEVTS